MYTNVTGNRRMTLLSIRERNHNRLLTIYRFSFGIFVNFRSENNSPKLHVQTTLSNMVCVSRNDRQFPCEKQLRSVIVDGGSGVYHNCPSTANTMFPVCCGLFLDKNWLQRQLPLINDI